jgi:phosphatidylinositol alpha-1,6-mannosyltransferase
LHTVKHLLVTNDFPPKVGGIQSYLWELWRRLPQGSASVLATPYAGAREFDAAQPFEIRRTLDPVLLPHPLLARAINQRATEIDADLILLDPALPLGLLGPVLNRPYGVIVHGAEVTLPGRIPLTAPLLGTVLRNASVVISAGEYPLAEAERAARRPLRSIVIPPGVDTERFIPMLPEQRRAARAAFGLPESGPLVTSVSRLVPRKGMDTLIRASARLSGPRPELTVAIAGTGRETARLKALATELGAPVAFMGRVDDSDLASFVGCGDVFAMLCRNRWFGLEQEGFGIVFLEAAACGVAQVAGRSGGSHEAVEHEMTGLIVDEPGDPIAVATSLATLIDDPEMAQKFGRAARERAENAFSYDILAAQLHEQLGSVVESLDA